MAFLEPKANLCVSIPTFLKVIKSKVTEGGHENPIDFFNYEINVQKFKNYPWLRRLYNQQLHDFGDTNVETLDKDFDVIIVLEDINKSLMILFLKDCFVFFKN